MFARTKRLFLRPPWPEDAAAYAAVHGEWDIVKNLGTAPWPFGIEDARERIAKSADIAPNEKSCVIFLRGETPELIGSIGFGRWNDRVAHVELGYSIARQHWGKGIAVEAATAILDVAFVAMGHSLVGAGHYVDNPASGRVLGKLGFEATGEILPYPCRARGCEVDSVEYLLTRERWLARRRAYREAA